ncbi:flagellar filament capping protein FliD [Solibacillus isronensis]|uniref:flagellar filament capping protein FliD n=1 Tax=Solibacillus isronensis TaxID=412383 RepID=UPI00203BEB73|nr:flagellar filament capping protein FliD [Solibacillus isronensis]MCM3722467.1 flagellar filament capping protein FliD [Solibacillus isronensis]
MSTMRIGGLASGMDIDSIVEKLMVAERMPMDKLEQQKQIYEWQRDAYRDVNKKMTTLDTYIADNFILKSLNTKTATSSNADLVSAVATGAASGSLSIEGVSQLAKAARGIGEQINATTSTKLSSLFGTETMPTKFTLNAIDTQGKLGKEVSIGIDANTTVGELITKINGSNAGVSAVFENGRLSLTAQNTGKAVDGGAAIKTDEENGKVLFGKLGLSKLVTEDGQNAKFQVNGIATERTTNSFSLNGYNITLKSVFNEGTTIKKAAQDTVDFAEKELKSTLTTLASKYNVTLSEDETIENQIKAVRDAITIKTSDEDPIVSAEAEEAKKLLNTSETTYTNAKKALDDVITNKPETTVPASTVTMTSSTNVDEILTKVKEFVATYNGFITDLTAQTKQPKYRDYQPLTELQKKEMDTKDIENWETRAKSGLLRNDSIITSGLSSLRGLVYQTNHAVTNQKYNALYTIGIGTSKDYMSGGTLEIDETKLRKALEEDPDAVVQLLTMSGEKSATVTKADGTTVQSDTRGFMRKIRDEMDIIEKKIDERAGRGSMTETQYTLGKYLRNVNQSLDAWKDKLVSIEDRYWKQFGAMEAMINKANSQSASLMSQYY